MVHVLLKPGLENFEHYFTSMWDESNCAVVWAFFCIAFLWNPLCSGRGIMLPWKVLSANSSQVREQPVFLPYLCSQARTDNPIIAPTTFISMSVFHSKLPKSVQSVIFVSLAFSRGPGTLQARNNLTKYPTVWILRSRSTNCLQRKFEMN